MQVSTTTTQHFSHAVSLKAPVNENKAATAIQARVRSFLVRKRTCVANGRDLDFTVYFKGGKEKIEAQKMQALQRIHSRKQPTDLISGFAPVIKLHLVLTG